MPNVVVVVSVIVIVNVIVIVVGRLLFPQQMGLENHKTSMFMCITNVCERVRANNTTRT